MAYKKVPRIHTLEFDGELEGLIVRIQSIRFGKIRKLLALMDEDDKDIELMGEITKYLVDAIISWNIQDENDLPVEPTAAEIDDLEFDQVIEIVNRWLDQMTGPSKDLGKDSSSGATFPGQPLTMEIL